MDRGAWRATVHGLAKSQTRLKQLSMHTRMTDQTFLAGPTGLPPCQGSQHLHGEHTLA